jgi:Ca2+-binding RTX toxin-like protein
MASIYVGAGRAYAKLSSAVQAARSGDKIYVDAGVYQNDFAILNKDLSIVGVGGKAHLKATQSIPNKKAILVVANNADVTLENMEFSGARVSDNNGAGIKLDYGSVTVRNSYFHDNQNGILTSHTSSSELTVQGSRFVDNGNGDYRTHSIYAGRIGKLSVNDTHIEATDRGSHVKSRAAYTEVLDSELIDDNGQSVYGIDLSEGNNALIRGNLLIQAADTSNRTMISYGSEGDKPGTLTVADNTFVNYRPLSTGVWNRTDNDAVVRDNTFVNVSQWVAGEADTIGNLNGTYDGVGSGDVALPEDKTLTGGAGNDRMTGGDGDDQIDGRGGNDLLAGGAGNDAIIGGDGQDTLQGGQHNDRLNGDAGNDWLFGNTENDSLFGGSGSDSLAGGYGNDVMQGGGGADRFIFGPKQGSDRITDFQDGVDKLNIKGVGGVGDLSIVKNSGGDFVVGFDDAAGSVTVQLSSGGNFGADDILIG